MKRRQRLDLENIELYCPNPKCGAPIRDALGQVHHTKRRMNYVGRQVGGLLGLTTMYAYMCPVCCRMRRFFKDDQSLDEDGADRDIWNTVV